MGKKSEVQNTIIEGQGGLNIKRETYKILIPFLILLGVTVGISFIYKALIEMGFFQLIRNKTFRSLEFCLFELILLAIYWQFVYFFSKELRHSCSSLKKYYIRAVIIFALFCIAYWLTYFYYQKIFSWIFRITLNLIAFRLETNAPGNFEPYMLAFLSVTFSIMMLEPWLAIVIYKSMEKEI